MGETSRIQLLLEAERRGILPADKKPLLDEARRRGLVPQGQPASAVSAQPQPAAQPSGVTTSPPQEQPAPEQASFAGPLSGLINTITEFASTSPPGGPRQAFIPEVNLPKSIEAAFTATLLTAAPTASATKIARQFVRKAPRAARFLPVLTEMASSFLARKANVAAGLEEPGTGGDIFSVAAPAATRGIVSAGRAIGGRLAPRVSQESAEILRTQPASPGVPMRRLIEEGEDVATAFQRGEVVRRAMVEAEGQLDELANQAFGTVRQKVTRATQNELIDITNISALSRRLGTRLDTFGVEVIDRGGRKLVTFDNAMKLRSKTNAQVLSKSERDRIGAAALGRIHGAIRRKVADVAKQSGAADDLLLADRMFAQDIAPRFRNQVARRVLNEVQTSAEQVISRAPTLSVQDARRLRDTIVNVADDLTPVERFAGQTPGARTVSKGPVLGARAIFTKSDAIHEFNTGVAARLLKQATNSETGQIQPGALLRALDRIEPEVQAIILGGSGASALRDFALRLSQSQRRLTMGIGVAGMSALSATGGAQAGPIGAVGALEAANELNMLGRLIVGNPAVFRRLAQRVLNGEPAATQSFTALTGVRISGEQLLRTSVTAPQPQQPAALVP